MAIRSLSASVSELASTFAGELLQPQDPGYDLARRVHNGLIDRRPALIARCGGTADIVDAVKLAQEHGLEVAVRGGGHNVAGRCTTDNGLMIDLAAMTGIRVDQQSRTAHAQGGVTWGLFNRETQLHGLATTGGVISTTGIAGLSLGGGVGWLMSRHGLSIDNLLSVDLVLADGRAVTASAQENLDLFWAVRGGGGNFGVASSFEYRLHPVGPTITGGVIAYPFSQAWDVLRRFRDITASLPDELTVVAGLTHAPDGSGAKVAAMVVCHCGSLADGDVAVQPIKSYGTPALEAIGPMPYSTLNSMLDASYPRGALNYWKSSFLAALSDEAIRTMIGCFEECPSPMGELLLEHFHGAVTRIAATDTAFPLRMEGYNLLVLSQWMEPKDNEACIAWGRRSYAAMQPFMGSARYVNYMAEDDSDGAAAAYGPNHQRLRQLKAKYDPNNFFRLNQNIVPSADNNRT
jgi:FAD/FMN-containing dehydrogenase